jgi:hypothetical protein
MYQARRTQRPTSSVRAAEARETVRPRQVYRRLKITPLDLGQQALAENISSRARAQNEIQGDVDHGGENDRLLDASICSRFFDLNVDIARETGSATNCLNKYVIALSAYSLSFRFERITG